MDDVFRFRCFIAELNRALLGESQDANLFRASILFNLGMFKVLT